jgi:hypothetical protein
MSVSSDEAKTIDETASQRRKLASEQEPRTAEGRAELIIGRERLEAIAELVASIQPRARCTGHYVLTAQEMLYGSPATLLSSAEWEELNAFLARRSQSGGERAAAHA